MRIDTQRLNLIDFKDAERKKIQRELFADSWDEADKFIANWNCKTYLRDCRGVGAPPMKALA